jgi:hypothetical protein
LSGPRFFRVFFFFSSSGFAGPAVVVGREDLREGQLALQRARALGVWPRAAALRELLDQIGVEVAHAREQPEDGLDERDDGALGDHLGDERPHRRQVRDQRRGERARGFLLRGHRRINAATSRMNSNEVERKDGGLSIIERASGATTASGASRRAGRCLRG